MEQKQQKRPEELRRENTFLKDFEKPKTQTLVAQLPVQANEFVKKDFVGTPKSDDPHSGGHKADGRHKALERNEFMEKAFVPDQVQIFHSIYEDRALFEQKEKERLHAESQALAQQKSFDEKARLDHEAAIAREKKRIELEKKKLLAKIRRLKKKLAKDKRLKAKLLKPKEKKKFKRKKNKSKKKKRGKTA